MPKQVVTWTCDDGATFDTEEAAVKHEQEMTASNEIMSWLRERVPQLANELCDDVRQAMILGAADLVPILTKLVSGA